MTPLQAVGLRAPASRAAGDSREAQGSSITFIVMRKVGIGIAVVEKGALPVSRPTGSRRGFNGINHASN
jgi:hypothetical protein